MSPEKRFMNLSRVYMNFLVAIYTLTREYAKLPCQWEGKQCPLACWESRQWPGDWLPPGAKGRVASRVQSGAIARSVLAEMGHEINSVI